MSDTPATEESLTPTESAGGDDSKGATDAARQITESLSKAAEGMGEFVSKLDGFKEAGDKAEKWLSDFLGAGSGMVQAGDALAGLAASAGLVKIGFDLVIDKAQEMSAETDKAWKEAGASAQGFFDNLAIGYGLRESPAISGIYDANKEASENIQKAQAAVAAYQYNQTHTESPMKRALQDIQPEERLYQQRMSLYHQHAEDTDHASQAFNKVKEIPLSNWKTGGSEFNLLSDAYKQVFGRDPSTDKPAELIQLMQAEVKRRRDADSAEYRYIQKSKPDLAQDGINAFINHSLEAYQNSLQQKRLSGTPDVAGERALPKLQNNHLLPDSIDGKKLINQESGLLIAEKEQARKKPGGTEAKPASALNPKDFIHGSAEAPEQKTQTVSPSATEPESGLEITYGTTNTKLATALVQYRHNFENGLLNQSYPDYQPDSVQWMREFSSKAFKPSTSLQSVFPEQPNPSGLLRLPNSSPLKDGSTSSQALPGDGFISSLKAQVAELSESFRQRGRVSQGGTAPRDAETEILQRLLNEQLKQTNALELMSRKNMNFVTGVSLDQL